MKHYFTFALLLGASASMSLAQTVVVIGKDGTATKFNAEDVKEITFEPKEVVEESVTFTSLIAEAYGKLATMTFSGEDTPKLVMDVYTGNASYLKAGTYEIAASGEYYIDSSAQWTYVEKDGAKLSVKSGSMTVENEKNDYTISIDFILSDDTEFKAEYKGAVDGFCQYKSFVISDVQQKEPNDALPGEIYLKINDASWSFEGTLDFYLDPSQKTIPAGVYNLNDELAAPCYGPKTGVDYYNPINDSYKVTTPITIGVDGANTSIKFEVEGAEGAVYEMEFNGEIKYLEAE